MEEERQPEFLGVRAAAKRLKVHENTVRKWAKAGVLDPVRLPGSPYQRFRTADVDRLIEGRQRTAGKNRPHKNPELVDAEYLNQWEGRRAQELLPDVVQRLIVASADVVGLTLRAGDGISAEGWDGEIDDCLDGSAWVPQGPSRWEIGTEADVQSKAQRDYEKRSKDPLGTDPATTTYVFVTQRRWRTAKRWERERRKDGIWRDVRVIDADLLAGWLASYPGVHIWLSEQVGLRPLEVRTVPDHWDRIASQTRPPLPPELLLAGRQEAADEFRRRLQGDPCAVFVRASSREESLAFVTAVLKLESDRATSPEEEEIPPAILARTSAAWERTALSMQPMVLVAEGQDVVDTAMAVAKGHHAVVPIQSGDPAPPAAIIDLPAINRTAAREALESVELPTEPADRLAALARRSFASLLRDPTIAAANRDQPAWAQGEHAQVLAPLVLVGRWAENEADQEIVARVADADWKDVEGEIYQWTNSGDAPFIESGGQWQVASPEGAWAILGGALRSSGVERFCAVAIDVLAENDPVLELPDEERPMAGVHNVRRRYSSSIRTGIAQGLALLGGLGDEPIAGSGRPGHEYARSVVRTLLEKAKEDQTGSLWASIADQLPRLAEASPRTFLDALGDDLGKASPVLRTIFRDRQDGPWFATSSPHTGLLWALETVAWSEENFVRATLALARLEEIDPGGKLGNRPSGSLRAIFLPWIPQTASSLETRLKALDRVRDLHSDVAWSLQLSLLPKFHDSSTPSSSPRFRDWKPSQERVTISEWIATVDALVERVIEDAGANAKRWSELVEHLGSLTNDQRERTIDGLDAVATNITDTNDRLLLWRAISDETAKHRNFASARWAMGDAPLSRLEGIAQDIEPTEAVERHSRLFDHRPNIPGVDGEDDDFDTSEARIENARQDAVKDTMAASGVEGLRRLASESKLPGAVGGSAARIAGDDIDDEMLELFDGTDSDKALAHGWSWAKAADGGDTRVRATAEKLASKTPETQASFLLAAPAGPAVWDVIDQADPLVGQEYWTRVNPFSLQQADLEFVTRKLLEHDRPWAAIDYLPIFCKPRDKDRPTPKPDLVVEALEQALSSERVEHHRAVSLGYEVGLLLDHLDSTDFDKAALARLEWGYFPLLEDQRRPSILYAALADDPDLFVELIARVFRGKNEPPREADEETAALAHHAYSVLHDWRRPPGLSDDGRTVDLDHLRSWVRRARQKLADMDRADIGDQQIGHLLSGSPPGADGAWPAEPVREIVEDLVSTHLETGLRIGRYNARGVTSRGVYEGGDRERKLAAEYSSWAKTIEDRWRRTARILNDLAEGYESEARMNDAEAERRATEG